MILICEKEKLKKIDDFSKSKERKEKMEKCCALNFEGKWSRVISNIKKWDLEYSFKSEKENCFKSQRKNEI